MSRKVKDLEAQIAVLEGRRDRVRKRLLRVSLACDSVGHQLDRLRYSGIIAGKAAKVFYRVRDDLLSIDNEYNRYYIEPKEKA